MLCFLLTFVGYSFINRYIALHVETGIDEAYLNLWIPLLVCYALSLFVFRPFMKQLNYKKEASAFLSGLLIPLSIGLPLAFSQEYVKDLGYKVITIDKPKNLDKYPSERFFKINHFVVDPSRYALIQEKYISGRNGSRLNLNSYFIIPVFDDTIQQNSYRASRVGYGIKFSRSLNNDIFVNDRQEEEVTAFRKRVKEDFHNYNFYNAGYFEKIKNTSDAKYFLEAESRSAVFEKEPGNIVLIGRTGTIQELHTKEKNKFLYTTLICLPIGLVSLFFIDRYQLKIKKSSL